jgi:hypothetical protein
MEISTQQVTEDVASKLWESNDPLGMKGPLEAQDKMVQYHLKNMVLPVVTKTLPIAEKHFKDKMRELIAKGNSLGMNADMILLDISMEIGE